MREQGIYTCADFLSRGDGDADDDEELFRVPLRSPSFEREEEDEDEEREELPDDLDLSRGLASDVLLLVGVVTARFLGGAR